MITQNFPGEPTQSQGVVDTAIRLFEKAEKQKAAIKNCMELCSLPGNSEYEYGRGLANGLIIANGIFNDFESAFIPKPITPAEDPLAVNVTVSTMFHLVKHMNDAFGNKEGDPHELLPEQIDGAVYYDANAWGKIENQCRNIVDEYNELMHAIAKRDLDQTRDALCDIMVFALGAFHRMGIDADGDMTAVVEGVMTRFIKGPADKIATITRHEALGVKEVYFEGDYPNMIMKSASDQPDAPKGKFLKSASFSLPVLPPLPARKD